MVMYLDGENILTFSQYILGDEVEGEIKAVSQSGFGIVISSGGIVCRSSRQAQISSGKFNPVNESDISIIIVNVEQQSFNFCKVFNRNRLA